MSVGFRAFLAALAIVLVTAVLVLIFTGEARTLDGASDNFFRNVLYDFQTLVAGALAIGAAWWTVRTQQVSDALSERRHRELVALDMRSDWLRVDRAFADIETLRRSVLRLRLPASMPQLEDLTVGERNTVMLEFLARCARKAGDIRSIHTGMNSPAIRDCIDLFDGRMNDAFVNFNKATSLLVVKLSAGGSTRPAFNSADQKYDTPLYQNMRKAGYGFVADEDAYVVMRDGYLDVANDFLDQAERLWTRYRDVGF